MRSYRRKLGYSAVATNTPDNEVMQNTMAVVDGVNKKKKSCHVRTVDRPQTPQFHVDAQINKSFGAILKYFFSFFFHRIISLILT